jgi:hypothetical protein
MKTHQSPEEILAAASPEQRIIWNNIFLTAGDRASLSQFYYSGLITSAEFFIYRARRMYFIYSIIIGGQNGLTNIGTLELYDVNNALILYLNSSSPVYDGLAGVLKLYSRSIKVENQYFSRLAIPGSLFTTIQTIGYRITF